MPIDDARALLQTLTDRPSLALVAIHVHVGSQITSLEPLRRAAALAADVSLELRQQGFPLEYVDLGGGLGVSYDGGEVPSAAEYVGALVGEVRRTSLPIVVEPGRAIAAPAGALVARVIDVKPRTASSDFAIIDAGMTELMRPALYNAFHRIEPVSPSTSRRAAVRNRRPRLRKQRRRRTRSHAAAARGGRSRRHSRRRRVRFGHGLELQSSSAAG